MRGKSSRWLAPAIERCFYFFLHFFDVSAGEKKSDENRPHQVGRVAQVSAACWSPLIVLAVGLFFLSSQRNVSSAFFFRDTVALHRTCGLVERGATAESNWIGCRPVIARLTLFDYFLCC